jgi:hypothetical protein
MYKSFVDVYVHNDFSKYICLIYKIIFYFINILELVAVYILILNSYLLMNLFKYFYLKISYIIYVILKNIYFKL